ncbi:TssQ family T6SS-associated lipoprotein [uncultured Piscinibacter sp.]|uniref:TssQ family T6SS-associated lipoprotein n=1 Tax=uncultured Piscinibacter sp. TaxID=1131835 RepID=UPI00260D99A9|nr:TssQ family T6SS-associated lipoprotein [uncultured Piscinibacter sp.]
MSLRPHFPALAAVLVALTGCVQPPTRPAAPVGLLDVAERPAEKALLAGMRAYDDAQYPQAEKSLQAALQAGLASPRDRAAAHKLLAFIFCTSNRASECEAQFRAALAADPAFALSKSESGHPLWGPVYQRVQR